MSAFNIMYLKSYVPKNGRMRIWIINGTLNDSSCELWKVTKKLKRKARKHFIEMDMSYAIWVIHLPVTFCVFNTYVDYHGLGIGTSMRQGPVFLTIIWQRWL